MHVKPNRPRPLHPLTAKQHRWCAGPAERRSCVRGAVSGLMCRVRVHSPSLYSNPRFSQSMSAVPGALIVDVDISGAATIRRPSPRACCCRVPEIDDEPPCAVDVEAALAAHGNRVAALAAGLETKLLAGAKESTAHARQLDAAVRILSIVEGGTLTFFSGSPWGTPRYPSPGQVLTGGSGFEIIIVPFRHRRTSSSDLSPRLLNHPRLNVIPVQQYSVESWATRQENALNSAYFVAPPGWITVKVGAAGPFPIDST